MKKVAKWSDLAEEILGSEDEIQRSYEVKLNGKWGYLIMSNRKLLFLEEEGFIRLKYSKALELPYSYIFEIDVAPNSMVILDGDGNEFDFTIVDGSLEKIGKELQDLIATS